MPARGQRIEKACAVCGTTMMVVPSLIERRKYCSTVCKHIGHSRKTLGVPRGHHKPVSDPRQCKDCGSWKPLAEFYVNTRRPGLTPTYFSHCKACATARANTRYDTETTRRRRYGVTLAELVVAQGDSLCALCRSNEAKVIDHDHATGVVRGAICTKCNLGLHYAENSDWMERARLYLEGRAESFLHVVKSKEG